MTILKINTFTFFCIALGISNTVTAAESIDSFKSTAKIENFCQIDSNNINFGIINSPLTQQGANGELNVLCNKDTPYTINLSYGGQPTSTNDKVYLATYQGGTSSYKNYFVKIQGESTNLGTFKCHSNGNITAGSNKVASEFGVPNVGLEHPDTLGICASDFSLPPQFSIAPQSSSGFMKGALHGNTLAYQIHLPNTTDVWKSGIGEHAAIASGNIDNITMQAIIVPNESSSSYLAGDSYLDTVTAIISY